MSHKDHEISLNPKDSVEAIDANFHLTKVFVWHRGGKLRVTMIDGVDSRVFDVSNRHGINEVYD